jgi:hypothetical protein
MRLRRIGELSVELKSMRVLPANRQAWIGLLLFPFKVYLPLGVVCLLAWKAATAGHRIHGALAEATGAVTCGYVLCVLIFVVTAAVRFATHRRELVAETLILAGIAFIIALLLLPWCATS